MVLITSQKSLPKAFSTSYKDLDSVRDVYQILLILELDYASWIMPTLLLSSDHAAILITTVSILGNQS